MRIETPIAMVLVTFVLLGAITAGGAAMTGEASASYQTNNSTSTPTATATATSTATPTQTEECKPRESGPQLQQARLYSPRPTITGDQHGQIAGSIAVDIQNECPVVVQVTMNVPSGMYIAGAGDLSSGGGGTLTSKFVVQPGETKSLRANVYSNIVGEKTVTADITYFPEGHKEQAREIDGIMLNFDVKEENMPNDPEAPSESPTSDGLGPIPNWGVVQWLLALVSLTTVGLLVLTGLGMVSITNAMPDSLEVIFERNK